MTLNIKIVQLERSTSTHEWPFPDDVTTPTGLTGGTITGVMTDENGETTEISGTLSVVDATHFSWAKSAGDSGTAGTFTFILKAIVSSVDTYTLPGTLEVITNPAVTGTQNDPLVSIPTDDADWVATSADGGALGTAAYIDTIDEDDMASDSDTAVPTQQSVKAYVDANAGGGDVGDLTTTGLTAANMLRVAAAGGLEERTPTQVRSDIGAEVSGAASTAVAGHLLAIDHDNIPDADEAAWLTAAAVAGAEATDNDIAVWSGGDLAATNQPRGYWMQRTAVPAGETVTIPANHQMVVVGDFTVDGELIAIGDLVIL